MTGRLTSRPAAPSGTGFVVWSLRITSRSHRADSLSGGNWTLQDPGVGLPARSAQPCDRNIEPVSPVPRPNGRGHKCLMTPIRSQPAVRHRQSLLFGLRAFCARKGSPLGPPRSPSDRALEPWVVALLLVVPPIGFVVWLLRYRRQQFSNPNRAAVSPVMRSRCGRPAASTALYTRCGARFARHRGSPIGGWSNW